MYDEEVCEVARVTFDRGRLGFVVGVHGGIHGGTRRLGLVVVVNRLLATDGVTERERTAAACFCVMRELDAQKIFM